MKAKKYPYERESLFVEIYTVGLVLLVAFGIIINVLVMGIDSVKPPPVPDLWNPPIYPGVQNITQQADAMIPPESIGPPFSPDGSYTGKALAFETADQPSLVLDYYRVEMQKVCWTLREREEAANHNQLVFSYYQRNQPNRYQHTVYYVFLTARPTDEGRTRVDLVILTCPGNSLC